MSEDKYRKLYVIQQVFASILSLSNKLQAKGDEYCKDITSSQLMTIMSILHIPDGKATVNNIAKKLTSTKQSTKHIINSLEKKKYVEIEPSTLDKRAVNVRVTDLGKEITIKALVSANNFLDNAFSTLTLEEVETLWLLLKKLYCFDGNKMDGFEENVDYKLLDIKDEKERRN